MARYSHVVSLSSAASDGDQGATGGSSEWRRTTEWSERSQDARSREKVGPHEFVRRGARRWTWVAGRRRDRRPDHGRRRGDVGTPAAAVVAGHAARGPD